MSSVLLVSGVSGCGDYSEPCSDDWLVRFAVESQHQRVRLLSGTVYRHHLHHPHSSTHALLRVQPHPALRTHLFHDDAYLHAATRRRRENLARYNSYTPFTCYIYFSARCVRENESPRYCHDVRPSVRLSGTGMYCDYTVHVCADLSLWLDSPMFWAPWHQSTSTYSQPFSVPPGREVGYGCANQAWYL